MRANSRTAMSASSSSPLVLGELPGHYIRRAQQVSSAYFTEELADSELTSVQMVALVAIVDLVGRTALALRLGTLAACPLCGVTVIDVATNTVTTTLVVGDGTSGVAY